MLKLGAVGGEVLELKQPVGWLAVELRADLPVVLVDSLLIPSEANLPLVGLGNREELLFRIFQIEIVLWFSSVDYWQPREKKVLVKLYFL